MSFVVEPSGQTKKMGLPVFRAYRTVAQVPDLFRSLKPLGAAIRKSPSSVLIIIGLGPATISVIRFLIIADPTSSVGPVLSVGIGIALSRCRKGCLGSSPVLCSRIRRILVLHRFFLHVLIK